MSGGRVKVKDVLKVGMKGEVYTSKKVREAAGIKPGGRVRAVVIEGRLILEPIPSIEEVIRNPVVTISVEEAERLSVESQKEEGVYG